MWPKRRRGDEGVWREVSPDSGAMAIAPAAAGGPRPTADGGAAAAAAAPTPAAAVPPRRCPLVICHKCTWGLTPEQHDNLEAIGAGYDALMDQLMRSDLPPLDQRKQCYELNGRLTAWEQDLMARNLIQ